MKVGVVRNPHHSAKRKKKYEGRGSLQWYYTNIMIMKCAVSEIIFNFFSYLLICTYMLYDGVWSCHENNNKKTEEEEERFDVLIKINFNCWFLIEFIHNGILWC